MRVLMSVLPAAGHWQPMVALGRALRQRGHEVVIASAPGLRAMAEADGFGFEAAGLEMFGANGWWTQLDDYRETVVPGDDNANMAAFRRFMVENQAPVMVEDLVRVVGDFGPDLLVHDNQEPLGAVAATVTGLPHAMVGATCLIPGPDAVRDRLSTLHGFPPVDPFRFLAFDRMPPALRTEPLVSVSPAAHSLRPVAADDAMPGCLGEDVLPGPNGRPLVYASLGTTYSLRPGVLETIIHGVAPTECELVITTAWRSPASIGPLPPNVTAVPYVPQSLVFRRAAVAVTHGGFNSLMGALAHGLPVVVVPLGADHFYNAASVSRCGVGVVLQSDELTAAAVRDAVALVLDDSRYRRRAQEIAAQIAAMPALDRAVSLLERLAIERAPVVA